MSRRSLASSTYGHERRISKHRVTDEDLFNFLAHLIQPKPIDSANSSNGEAPREREHSSRLSGAISSSIFSIGDLFKDSVRDGTKSVKFPEKLLKVLEQRLEDIAMGKDQAYSDQLLRRTMAVFYGQFKVDSFKRQMKENRKIEELILMFATHATGVLKKDQSLAGDAWKVELNKHIAQFVKLLRESLRAVSHVSPELTSRLDMYAAKLAPAAQAPSDSGYDSASTSRDRDSIYSVPGLSINVADMPLVMIVSKLFQIRTDLLQNEVDKLRPFCTERAALLDLKTCLKNINAGEPFPGRREDFDNDAAWQYWRTLETSHLSQLMVVLVQFNPELAKSTPSDVLPKRTVARPGSVYSAYSPSTRNGSISSRRSIIALSQNLSDIDFNAETIDEEDEVQAGHNFTYIPPNPKKYYKRLLEYCLDADLTAMRDPNVSDDDQVSLGILSHSHIELINECALRWRISQPYRAACFLDLIKQLYERNEVPLDCIPEALGGVAKVMNEISFDKWPTHDSEYLVGVYGSLVSVFLAAIYHAMDAIPALKKEDVLHYLSILDQIKATGLLDRFDVDIGARVQDIKDRVRVIAAEFYHAKMVDLQTTPGVNRALPLLLLTDELEKAGKLLDKRFPEPILEQIDLVALLVEVTVPMFLQDLDASRKRLFESSMNGPTPDVPIEDIFSLYRRTKTLVDMHGAFCPDLPLTFNLGEFFEPYVRTWLSNTDNKTGQWVANFEAEGAEGHSSSIVDLFDSLRSPISFLQDLEWADTYQEARFFTSVAKTISKAVEQYCRSIEELFMAEMFPRPTDYLQPQKSSAWLEKAKQLAQGEKKIVEPFNFQPASCVKLNNIEAASKLLDNMYNQMQADKLADVIAESAPPVPTKNELPRFLFTVKVVTAEGLVPLDASPSSTLDTFVTLSDEAGHRLAKTRTIYETNDPRWDETFDISVDKALWLMVSVRDRALVGKHDTVGREYICLDPRRYGDFLVHDVWLDLDSAGRILLRISMEGEKDDIQFYFGRAFRSLKRGEGDMVRIFIDKMAPFIRQTLSRSVLKSLIKGGTSGLDYNKALGNVTALYRSALGNNNNAEPLIPLPPSEKPRVKPEELTDVELEQAIIALFDYFDANLQTINTYLSETTKQMVMTRLWKEILATIEGLLIPPLSDQPSDLKPLSDKEVDIVFKWLKFLRDYFYAGGEGPIPVETLQNQKYRDVVSIRLYYDWHTDALMEECVRMMQQTLRASPTVKKRVKSVYSQRNLGTIKERKKEKAQEKEISNGETIMRILRMRSGTSDFLSQQLQIMATMQAEQEQREREKQNRKLARPKHASHIPEVPAIPEIPPLP
ncbi:hypothetical protein FA95DRAFT_1483448 [Auriscalpium vulgare]|uniref:Uncharacterized protein n=1 Tax=Auriscalpium vulgare TaxID=40419 RepID=A0ACB8S8I1_9AGAM|nr:hypothetical protein FA95DRAFT_1483448 [Auriscalpium vulgare]